MPDQKFSVGQRIRIKRQGGDTQRRAAPEDARGKCGTVEQTAISPAYSGPAPENEQMWNPTEVRTYRVRLDGEPERLTRPINEDWLEALG